MLRVALAALSIFALTEGGGEDQGKTLFIRSYPVGDLSVWSRSDDFNPSVLTALLETVEPDSWASSGKGKGEITPDLEKRLLHVAQTAEVHESIAKKLDKLREDDRKQLEEGSWHSTRDRVTRVYAISDLVTPWPLAKQGQPDFDSLVDLIKGTIDAGQWDVESAIEVDETRYLLTVTHAPVIHTEIKQLLADLRTLNEQYANRIEDGKCGHCGLGTAPTHGERCNKCNIERCDPFTVPSRN